MTPSSQHPDPRSGRDGPPDKQPAGQPNKQRGGRGAPALADRADNRIAVGLAIATTVIGIVAGMGAGYLLFHDSPGGKAEQSATLACQAIAFVPAETWAITWGPEGVGGNILAGAASLATAAASGDDTYANLPGLGEEVMSVAQIFDDERFRNAMAAFRAECDSLGLA